MVPVYFNEGSLQELHRRLAIVAGQYADRSFEFIMVDDGSRDGSFAVLAGLAKADPRVRVLRLSRNFGSNAALLAGLGVTAGDAVICISADLQDPPEIIPRLIEEWDKGAEVVLAQRNSRQDPWISRLFASAFNHLFRYLVAPDFPKEGMDCVLLDRRAVTPIVRMAEKNSFLFGQVLWVGFSRAFIGYDRESRREGESRWTFAKKVKYFIDAFSAFSYLPLRASTFIGLTVASGGFLYALVVIAQRLFFAREMPGFAALMVVLLVTSGTQLVLFGVLGEYLWRVLEEVRRRPPYIVAASLNVDAPAEADPGR